MKSGISILVVFRRHRWCAISPISVPWSVCLSVSLYVWHVRALCSNDWSYRHDFFCLRQLNVSHASCYNLACIGRPIPPQIVPQNDTRPC